MSEPTEHHGDDVVNLCSFAAELAAEFERVTQETGIDAPSKAFSAAHQVRKGIRAVRDLLQEMMVSGDTVQGIEVARRIRNLSVSRATLVLLSQIGDRMDSPAMRNVQNPYVGFIDRQRALATHMYFKMDGEALIRSAVAKAALPRGLLFQERYADDLAVLEKKVREAFGPEYAGLAELLFALHGDIRTVSEIVISQTRVRRKHPDTPTDNEHNFGQHLLGFIGMYGDVSMHVIERCGDQGVTEDHTFRVLRHLLEDQLLRGFHEVTDHTDKISTPFCNVHSPVPIRM